MTHRFHVVSCGRNAYSIFDACLESEVVELAFFGKVGDIVVRSNEYPDRFVLQKPVVINLGPIFLYDFHSRDFGQLLSCSTIFRTGKSDDAVESQFSVLE